MRKAQALLASDVRADYDTQGEKREREREREREERKKERRKKKQEKAETALPTNAIR